MDIERWLRVCGQYDAALVWAPTSEFPGGWPALSVPSVLEGLLMPSAAYLAVGGRSEAGPRPVILLGLTDCPPSECCVYVESTRVRPRDLSSRPMSTEPTPHPDPPTSVLDARVSIADPRCPLVPPRAAHRRLHHRCRRARPRQGARPQEQRPAVSPRHRGVQAHLHPDAPSSRSVSSVIDTIGIPSRGCRGRRRHPRRHPAASGGDGARAVAPLRVRRRTRRRREKARRSERRGPRDGHGIAGAYPDGGERELAAK